MTAPSPRRRPYVLRDNAHAMAALDGIRADRGVSCAGSARSW